MILNLRVDHKMADIQSMENISKDMDELFWKLQEKYSIGEYIEISTCNRKEYYIKNDYIQEDKEFDYDYPIKPNQTQYQITHKLKEVYE